MIQGRRIFFLGVNTGYVENETPTAQHIAFHEIRSGNGLYCTIVGNVLTPRGHATNAVCARISKSPQWKQLTEGIQRSGAIPGIQLSSTWQEYLGLKKFKTIDPIETINDYKIIAKSFHNNDIIEFYSDLQQASDIAIETGFKHIQLHAAHGYLYNLLLDPYFSPNYTVARELTEKWADNLRTRGIESSIRISIKFGVPHLDDQVERLNETIQVGCDYIDISQGLYNVNKRVIYPSTSETLDSRWKMNITLARKNPGLRFIASGRLQNYRTNLDALPENLELGICRDLIANPNFLQDFANGCENKMKCHYFSRGTPNLSCGKWIED